jgi:hypothetical protein
MEQFSASVACSVKTFSAVLQSRHQAVPDDINEGTRSETNH